MSISYINSLKLLRYFLIYAIVNYTCNMTQQFQDSHENMLFDKIAFIFKAQVGYFTQQIARYEELYRDVEDITDDEINQVMESRRDITEQKSRRFRNFDEYVKSFNSDE